MPDAISRIRNMPEVIYSGEALWARIERAVENVKDRMRRVALALEEAGVTYAVIGGNAVQYWVAQVDESVVRNTRDVDIILNEDDLPRAIESLSTAGFVYRQAAGVTMFLDGAEAKSRDAVHVVFAGQKVRPDHPEVAPLIDDAPVVQGMRIIPLEKLVRMKLTSYRRKDQVHLLDLISVGLVDRSWLSQLPESLHARLIELLDDPDG
jgi:hypothetical protein